MLRRRIIDEQKRVITICVILISLLSGCATLASTQETTESSNIKESYEFNFSTTAKNGYLLIHAVPPGRQLAIHQYGVRIDDRDTVLITKYSDALFILDEGNHKLEIFALPHMWKGVYGQTFGKPTIEQIYILEGEKIVFEYMGPFLAWGQGKLKK